MSKKKETTTEKNVEKKGEKRPYTTPKLTVHGDVEDITQGSQIGEELDAGFTTSAISGRRPKSKRFS